MATLLMTFDGNYDNSVYSCLQVIFLLIIIKFCLDIGEKSDFAAGILTKQARARNHTMIELFL